MITDRTDTFADRVRMLIDASSLGEEDARRIREAADPKCIAREPAKSTAGEGFREEQK